MQNWETVKLGDISEVIGGGTPSTKNYDFWDGEIPWLTPKDLSGYKNRYISRGERNISEKGLQNSSARMLPKGTVLLTSRAPIGYLAIAENTVCTNQGFKSLILKDNYLPEFFYYLLKNNIEYIIGMSSGSTFAEISGKQVKALEFRVPPLPIQKKIAAVLSALDDKIELNNKINQNLEQQAQAIFKSWFVDFEPFGGKMPDDWKIGKLGDLVDITMGQSPDGSSYNEEKNGSIFFQGRAEFNFRFPNPKLYTTQPKRMARKNDVLMSIRAPVGDYNLAYDDCCIGRGLCAIRSKIGAQSFAFYLIWSLQKILDTFNGEGTVFGAINKNALNDLSVIIPTFDSMKRFENVCSPLDELIRNNSTENLRLSQLRDALLPKLMSGEIDVSKVDVSDTQMSFNSNEV
ncbi:MAG: restriction endonuclease subunit S [Alphaproteobacteria bacterium]|nr:restriction endonuclease subunit S [Alphaproteobacteria bacterium]